MQGCVVWRSVCMDVQCGGVCAWMCSVEECVHGCVVWRSVCNDV